MCLQACVGVCAWSLYMAVSPGRVESVLWCESYESVLVYVCGSNHWWKMYCDVFVSTKSQFWCARDVCLWQEKLRVSGSYSGGRSLEAQRQEASFFSSHSMTGSTHQPAWSIPSANPVPLISTCGTRTPVLILRTATAAFPMDSLPR